MDAFIKSFLNAARKVAIEHHCYVEEDGVLLSPETIKLVAEIEDATRQHKIDQALANGDRELFMQLTEGSEMNA